MDARNRAAVDLLVEHMLRPEGDMSKVPLAEHATFVGPMVQHLDREELIELFAANFNSNLEAPLPIIERTDGERFSTITTQIEPPDDNPEADTAHFVAEVANGEIVALQMAFNSFRYPQDRREMRTKAAEEWRATRRAAS